MSLRPKVFGLLLATLLFGPALATPLDDATETFKSQRYAEALTLLEPLANSGVPEAQRMLGEMYFAGNGVVKNKATAFKWTSAAASGDDRLAQFSMGYIYQKGEGVAASNTQAIEFYRKSALQRYVPAMVKLADLYRTSDYGAAKYWYSTAAQFGNEEAQEKFSRIFSQEIASANEVSEQRSKLRKTECAASCSQAQRDNCERGFVEPDSCTIEDDMPEVAYVGGSGGSAGTSNPFAEQAALFAAQSSRISQIYNQGMAGIQAQKQQRQRQEQYAREQQRQGLQLQQQRAESERNFKQLADARSQADPQHQLREQEEARTREQRESERRGNELQRVQDLMHNQAVAKEQRERENSERLAKAGVEKTAKAKAVGEYLAEVRRQFRLTAKTCPDGEGKYYAVGINPKVKPVEVACYGIKFRAQCRGGGITAYGETSHFSSMSTSCFAGESVSMEPKLSCKPEQVEITVTEITPC